MILPMLMSSSIRWALQPTPLFAVARILGWSAHRIDELLSANKIIRPAYKSLGGTHDYIPRDAR